MNAGKSLPMDSENSSRRSTHKTLNVRLLAISVVVVLVVGVAVYFWHAAQVSRLKAHSFCEPTNWGRSSSGVRPHRTCSVT